MPAYQLQPHRFRGFALVFFFLLLHAIPLPGYAQQAGKIQKLLKSTALKKKAAADSLVASNKIYDIVLEDRLGNGVGLFSLRTGRNHPINANFGGAPQDLLGGGGKGETGTSYISIRSYSSNTDYVQSDFIKNDLDFKTAWLDSLLLINDSFNAVQPLLNAAQDTVGFEVTYTLVDTSQMADRMRITARLELHGATFADSWVEVTIKVVNTGGRELEIGIRYLLDLKVGEDDGAELIASTRNTSFGNTEKELKPLNFAYLRGAANERIKNIEPPAYHIYSSVITPDNLLRALQPPLPKPPALLQQVFWPLAFLKPFNYQVDSTLTITQDDTTSTNPVNRTGGDNAILYFWGETIEKALRIAPGDSIQVTQGFFASPPDVSPPLLERTPPGCTFTFRGVSTVTGFFSDAESGIAEIKPLFLYNAKLLVDPFMPGDKKVNFRLEGLGEDSYLGFDIKITDISGNSHVCDPVMAYLAMDRAERTYTFKFRRVDRYLTLANRGLAEIHANLNGHRFDFYSTSNNGVRLMNAYRLPQEGSLTIDLQPYLRDEENVLQIEIAGPAGANADLTLMDEAHAVDHALNLTPIPQHFVLSQNLPNPFSRHNGTTEIRFEVPERPGNASRVELKIYNLLGQVVRALIEKNLPAGAYTARWNGRNAGDKLVPSGIYFYVLTTHGVRITKKMTFIQ